MIKMARRFHDIKKSVKYFLHFLFWNDIILAAHPSNLRKGQGFDGKPHCLIQAVKAISLALPGVPGYFGGFPHEQKKCLNGKGCNEDHEQKDNGTVKN